MLHCYLHAFVTDYHICDYNCLYVYGYFLVYVAYICLLLFPYEIVYLQKVIVCLCFLCKYFARVLYVYVIIACSLKRKFMWHKSVEYWVCYSMFYSERKEVFPCVAWPSHGWLGTLQKHGIELPHFILKRFRSSL
jgi:hypothetical protein